MQQKILILTFNLMVLACYLVHSENSPPIAKTADKNIPSGKFSGSWDLSDCGRRAIMDDRLSDEAETNVSKWPWVASIYFMDPLQKKAEYRGTASIITEKHLITASRVFTGRNATEEVRPSDYFAVVGGEFGHEGRVFHIQSILTSPVDGEEQPFLGDIAIVQLMNTMTLSDILRPVCLPRVEDENNEDYQDKNLTVVSWIYSPDNFSEAVALYDMHVPILPDDYCQQFIPGTYPIKKLMCGLDSDEITSEISNGAPLIVLNYDKILKDHRFTLIGITDRDIGSSPLNEEPVKPTYFMKVTAYVKWITKIIETSRD